MSLIHKAGVPANGVQRCVRCDVILVDNRNVEIAEDDRRGLMFFNTGVAIERNGTSTTVSFDEPNCKSRESILAAMRTLRDKIRLEFSTLDHWNERQPEGERLTYDDIDPDGTMRAQLAQYDMVLAAEADRLIPTGTPPVEQNGSIH